MGGTKMEFIADQLATNGLSMDGLPAAPRVSLVGAAATGSHGSDGPVSKHIVSFDVITAEGDEVSSRILGHM